MNKKQYRRQLKDGMDRDTSPPVLQLLVTEEKRGVRVLEDTLEINRRKVTSNFVYSLHRKLHMFDHPTSHGALGLIH